MLVISQKYAGLGGVGTVFGMNIGTITVIFSSIFSLCLCFTIIAVVIRIRLARSRQASVDAAVDLRMPPPDFDIARIF